MLYHQICILGMNFMQKFMMGWYVGTVPAWMLYTLHGQQWQIGNTYTLVLAIETLTSWLCTIYCYIFHSPVTYSLIPLQGRLIKAKMEHQP